MTFGIETVIGAAATAASISSFAPQASKIIETRETSSISTGMYVLTVIGFSLWLAYGAALGQWPLMITNGVCLALATFILVMKLLPASSKNSVADAMDPEV